MIDENMEFGIEITSFRAGPEPTTEQDPLTCWVCDAPANNQVEIDPNSADVDEYGSFVMLCSKCLQFIRANDLSSLMHRVTSNRRRMASLLEHVRSNAVAVWGVAEPFDRPEAPAMV